MARGCGLARSSKKGSGSTAVPVRLMASYYWVATAASPNTADRDRFFDEATRRLELPEYRQYSPHDPLMKWATVESHIMLTWLRQGPTSRNPPLTMSETDRCHAQ